MRADFPKSVAEQVIFGPELKVIAVRMGISEMSISEQRLSSCLLLFHVAGSGPTS